MARIRTTGTDPGPIDDLFELVVGPLIGELVRVSRRILGSEDLALDAVQESLLSLWQQDEAPPNPRSWLSKAVIFRSLHLARTIRRRHKHEASVRASRPEASVRDEPTSFVTLNELSPSLADALDRLSEEQRVALNLLVFEGMDYESIARALCIPIGTVRSRIHRSRESLRRSLERTPPGGSHIDE